MRGRFIRANPLCARCLADGFTTGAEQVDHIVPAHIAPDRFFDPGNLQSLCLPCHRAKTAEDAERYGQPGGHPRKGRDGPDIGPDGWPIEPPEIGPDGLPVDHSGTSTPPPGSVGPGVSGSTSASSGVPDGGAMNDGSARYSSDHSMSRMRSSRTLQSS